MSRWLKVTLITIAVIFGLFLSTMLIVPWQLKKQGSNWIAENTDRTLTIETAFFNPFTLTVEIEGIKLTEQSSEQTFIAFKRVLFSGSVSSIIRQAIIFDRVELDDPFVNIELLGKQEFNFSDFTRLGADNPKPATTEVKEPLHFSLNNIILTGGTIDFTDQTSAKKSQHQIRELALRIPFIGNIPYLTDDYVEPSLYLLLNDAEIQANGKLKPFHDSLETELFLTFDDIDLAYYAFHSPVPLPIDVKQGRLDCDIDISYQVSKNEQPRLLVGGNLALTDIDLRELDGRKLFNLPSLALNLNWADLFLQDYDLTAINITAPQIYIDRDSSGQWNFQRILAGQKTEPVTTEVAEVTTSADESTKELPLLEIEKLTLSEGQIHYRDDFVPLGFSEEIRAINLEINHLSTHLSKKTGVTLSLQSDRNFTTTVDGNLGINPVTADINFNSTNLPLKPYYPYLEELLTAPIAGILNLAGNIVYTETGNIQLHDGQLELNDLLVPFTDKDQFTLSSFNISNSAADLQLQNINLGTIELAGGNVKATLLSDGSFSPLQLLREQPPAESIQTAANETPSEPWNIGVNSIDLQKFKLLVTDRTSSKNPQVNIADFNLHAENLSYPQSAQSPFSANVKLDSSSHIALSGAVAHSPLQLQLETKIDSLALADFNDFVPDDLNLSLRDGKLSSTFNINLNQQADQLNGNFTGKIKVADFNLRDPLDSGELLTWKNLNITGIKGKLAPFELQVTEISLSDYRTNILVDSSGQINLASITATKDDSETTEDKPKDAVITINDDKPVTNDPPPDIRIETVTLQNGTVSFIDRSMNERFSATMYKLGGRITGMASAEDMQADINLSGQLENHSPLTISGKINPLSNDLFADLTISFKDIDLTPMTPYAGTYLGNVIDKGKLYLDLNYHIEKRKISATNKALIDQFTLGESVASDKATSLPVGLAISLLKDSSDEIHLNIPVSGDFDDPDFSIGGVIFTVLKNLLVKAATSPFSLLTAMVGGDEDFSGIDFASGIAEIDAKQMKKLETLAGLLANRPALTLEISGFADAESDPEGYRQDQLQQLLVAAKWDKLKTDARPVTKEEIVISAEEYPKLLLTVYKQADFPRERNFVGMLKTIPAAEMEQLILANVTIGEEQLQELAKARAIAVRTALVTINEEIKPRLFLKKLDIDKPQKEGAASRVEFNISSK